MTTYADVVTRPTRTPNKWLILVAMTGALSMVMLDQTVVSVALPSMSRELPLTASGQQWVINAYVLAMAALVAFGGKVGDVLGRVSTFRLGVLVFFLASAGCALVPHGADGQAAMIAARAAQGVGAALMMPVSAAIVMAAFPDSQRGRAMAMYAGISQIFLAIGPLLGGYLTEYVSWRAVFWLNVPVGLAALLLVRIARPPNPKQANARVRTRDLVLLSAGIALTVYAIQQASHWGWLSTATLGTVAVGLALTATFVVVQLRAADPLIKVRLFTIRGFLADNVVMGLLQFGLLGIVLYSSLYGQDLLGFSPITAGLSSLPLILPIALAAQLGGRWFDQSGVRAPVLTGLTFCLAGAALWTVALPHLQYGWQVPGMILTGFGLGLTISPTNTDGMGRVDGPDRGQASGLIQTIRQLGGTIGIAVIGAVVLGASRHGTQQAAGHAAAQQAANAITYGFAVAVGAFALALAAGWWLLPRRVTDGR
jgi:EmrB/QacA subfamily drug resistance transporter